MVGTCPLECISIGAVPVRNVATLARIEVLREADTMGPVNASSRAVARRVAGLVLLIVVVVGVSAAPIATAPDSTPPPTTVPIVGTAATPAPTLPDAKTVRVTSIQALLDALDDDSIDVIVVKDGTYRVSPSNEVAADSLWIGKRFADRTRPILVRAETRGGVTFRGDGEGSYGGLSFEDGAHHQTWDGFNFANMAASQTGIIEVGGYVPRRPPHHITVTNIRIESSATGRATTMVGSSWDHGIYIAHAAGTGPHDLIFEDIYVDGRGGLASAVHFDHGDEANPAASDVTVRRLTVLGTQQAIILWEPALHDITFDSVTIRDALRFAIRYESIGASGITFANITSIRSGCQGFFSSEGTAPPGVTFVNADLDPPRDPAADGCPD